jgi:hypothetical protein
MAKTITKTVYTFQELLDLEKQGKADKKAVERARQWLTEGLQTYDWWDSVYEWWTTALEQIGFQEPKISFRGFWSQGDGASFTACVDLETLIGFLSTPVEASESVGYDAETKKEDFRARIVHDCNGVGFNPKYSKLRKVADAGKIDATVERNDSHYSHERSVRFASSLQDDGDCIGQKWISDTPRLRKLFEGFQSDACQLVLDLCRAIYKDLQAEFEYRTSDETLADDSDANEYTFEITGRRDG